MRATLRLLALTLCLTAFASEFADAQYQSGPPPAPPPQRGDTFTPNEVVSAGSRFFGSVSSGLAKVVETAFSRWGQPNGYVLGQEASGAFIGGFGMTALGSGDIIVVPIRAGVGLRLGANLGYIKFTPQATWNPF